MGDVASLLRETSETETEKIRCRSCDAEIDDNVDLCPHCGEPAKLTTLSELGRQLPIGILEVTPDGKKRLMKDFDVTKLDWKKEREVSAAWKSIVRRPNIGLLDYISCVLAHTVTVIGGNDLSRHNVDRRMYILGEMFVGDVFYMYAYLRVHSLGPEFQLRDIECPRCGESIKRYDVDLSTLEVSTRTDPDKITQRIMLRYGFTMAKEVRKELILQPASFRVMSTSDVDDDAMFFAAILKSTCREVVGVPGDVITDQEIEQLDPYDIALIRDANDWLAGGIVWNVEVQCQNPMCKAKFDHYIDWRHGNFFAISSRSPTPRRRFGR